MKICMKCLLIIVWFVALAGCGTTSTYYITSNPSGASVKIDGTVVGATPIEVVYDDPVNKELVLTKEGYKTIDFPLKTLRSPRESMHFDLHLIIGPDPTEPEVYWEVTIESIPSGAAVYGLRPDMKTLGAKLGTTPCTIKIGLAEPYLSDGRRYQNDAKLQVFGPANARKSEFDKVRDGRDILVDLAIYDESKDRWVFLQNHPVGFLKDYNHNPWPPSPITMTVPFGIGISDHGIAKEDPNVSVPSERPNQQAYEAAKQEYEEALAAYQNALSELDSAKNMRSLSNMSFGTMMSGSKLDRAMGLLNQGSTHLSLQDAERNVVIARERLERAKARLDAMNWK